MLFPASTASLKHPGWLFFAQLLVWIHDSAVSPGPTQGLALPKPPGTYLPESLLTSKTPSPPGQVPFLAYYIVSCTFSVFSPLSVESCADLRPPNRQLENEVKLSVMCETRMTLIHLFSPEFMALEGSPLCSGKASPGESNCLLEVTHAAFHSLPPTSLDWRRKRNKRSSNTPPTYSPLPPPLQSESETQGKQLGDMSN